jgi:hypothetical protein
MNLSFGEYYSEHMVKHEIFFKRESKGGHVYKVDVMRSFSKRIRKKRMPIAVLRDQQERYQLIGLLASMLT